MKSSPGVLARILHKDFLFRMKSSTIRRFALSITIAALLAIPLAVAAGGGMKESGGAQAGPNGRESTAVKRPIFVMVPKGVHPYFVPVYEGFKMAAKRYGVQVEMDAPPRFDVDLQVKVIEDLIARGVDGIAISANDDKGLVAVVHEAMQAGIKVITFDAPAPSTEALTYIGTDNRSAGYESGLWMAKAMDYHGELAILQGGLDATNLNLRTEGFKEALAVAAPSIKVVALVDEGGDFAESVIKTEELQREFPRLHGVFSVSAEGAPAAAMVVKEEHLRGRIVVAGFDDLKDTLDGIRDGSVAFCVVQNTYKMGWLSVEQLLDAIHNRPIPKVIDTGVTFVDKSNVDTYMERMRQEAAALE